MAVQTVPIDLTLHPKQELAYNTRATELLYGGSAGGGKSMLLRVAAIDWCNSIPGLQVYLFRRIREDLIKNHVEGPKGFRSLLAPWINDKFCSIVDDEIRFWNGSKIYLCHCKDEKDVYRFQGSEIHCLLIDELTHFTESQYRFLRNRLRMVGLKLPDAWFAGRFPRIICGSNPGNIGHLWVARTFVTCAPPFEVHRASEKEGGLLRQYIPARLEDNPSMAEDDPGYEQRLMGLGSPQLVKAMRWGDWSVVEGQFFPEWNPDTHVIEPFPIPDEFMRFMVIDHGTSEPAAICWFFMVGDAYQLPNGKILPKGSMILYREKYLSEDHNNVGLNKTAEEIAEIIADAERYEPRDEDGKPRIAYRECDTALLAGNPSVAMRMGMSHGLHFRMAKNKRIGRRDAPAGWDYLRQRLKTGMFYVFSSCIDTIRTLPALVHDPDRPGDCVSEAVEDHLGDACRYASTSRPWVTSAAVPMPMMSADDFDTRAGASWITIDPPEGGWDADLKEKYERPKPLHLAGRRIP
jgi:hypothetical protein